MNPPTAMLGSPPAGADSDDPAVPRPWWRRLWPLWLGLAVAVGLGSHLGRHQRQELEEGQRARLLLQAEGLARHLNPDLIRNLASGATDAGRPAFQVLREQLATTAREFPNQGLFLVTQRGGKCLFGPASYDAVDPMARPVGTEFRQPPDEVLAAFQSGRSTVAGPYADARGTFLSAFVPIRDERTGEVLMVLGVDEPASVWRGRLAERLGLPGLGYAGLSLVLLATAAWVGWGWRGGKPAELNLRRSVLVPIAIALLAVTVAYAWREFDRAKVEQLHAMGTLASQGELRWSRILSSEAKVLEAELDQIARNPDLVRFMEGRNLAGLERISETLLAGLRQRFGISRFVIVNPDQTCLLRAENHLARGDVLAHGTLQQAQLTGGDAWGMEVDPQGAFILRFVRPWRLDGRLVGYLELGTYVPDQIRRLVRDMGVDYVLLLRKKASDRAAFEQGKGLYHYAGNWDAFPELAILQQSFPLLPEPLLRRFQSPSGLNQNLDALPMTWEGRSLVSGGLRLPDISGRTVGTLLLLQDVSGAMSGAHRRLITHLSLAGLILLTTLAVLWGVTGEAEGRFRGMLNKAEASEAAFHRLFSDHTEVMLLADPSTLGIIEANHAAEAFYGYPADRLAQLTVAELSNMPPGQLEAVMAEAIQKGSPYECAHRLASGEVRRVEMRMAPITWQDRTVLFGIISDITAQKEAEANLRKAAEELGAMNRELAEARDQALSAVEARSRFLANISHEIRTPLNGLLGMAELLSDMDLTAEQRDHVAWISRCGSSLFSFLNDILDFSKMEAGQLSLETISFDLRNLVYDAAELFRARLAGHRVELLVDYDSGAPTQVLGDAGRLRQILNNLMSNAVKFTPQGHIRIGVRSIPLAGPRHRMVLSVQDTGIGIPRSKHASLFDPFVQAEASTARRYGGTGLGLAIVKGLVEAMNGRISLASEEGAGSTFTVEIELQMDPSSTQESPAEAGLGGMRLLLVADVPTNLDALRRQLMGQGALIEEAVSGTAALTCIQAALGREDPFDLVVVDLIKPGDMDGDALGQAIRADARCRATALAALTSTGFKGDPARLSRIGFNAYLLKPMPGDQLCRSLALAILHARQTPGSEMITRYTLMASRLPEPQVDALLLRGKILIVEDQETNQIVLRKLLERVGATVVVAANGVEALAAVAGCTFDLVLMDCQMPEMDGLEATARIRASEQGTGRHLPIIAMTAHATAENRERCLAVGMDAYLTKPIQREAILKAVSDWIQVSQVTSTALESAELPGSPLASADPALGLDRDLFGKLLGLYDEDAKALGQELVGPFLTSSEERLELLKRCLAANDFEALASGAHAIKGSARTLGFTALGSLMEQLEREAKAGQKLAPETCLQEAMKAISLVREFHQRLMA